MKRLKVIAFAALAALILLGAAYGMWNERVTVNATLRSYDWDIAVCDDSGNCRHYTEDADFADLTIAYGDETKLYRIKNGSNVPVVISHIDFLSDDTADDFSYSVTIGDEQVVDQDALLRSVNPTDKAGNQMIIDSAAEITVRFRRQPSNQDYLASQQAVVDTLKSDIAEAEDLRNDIEVLEDRLEGLRDALSQLQSTSGVSAQNKASKAAANLAVDGDSIESVQQNIANVEEALQSLRSDRKNVDLDELEAQLKAESERLTERQNTIVSDSTARALAFQLKLAPNH
ncbi:MAG: hypothetical protein CSA13_01850 [Clostridiales bacterium]|nr:MAG: hypothetical protein CSA13_01850 [Clostridiales bacterium]